MVGSSHVVQDAVDQVGPTGLSVAVGMVALTQQEGLETAVGSEVGAVLAHRFERAVALCGPLAPAVAEEPMVHLGPRPAHIRAFGCRWEDGILVKGLDFG